MAHACRMLVSASNPGETLDISRQYKPPVAESIVPRLSKHLPPRTDAPPFAQIAGPFLDALIRQLSRQSLCVLLENSLSVHANMIQIKNDQDRFTAERVLRTRPKTYRAIVLLLADPGATVMHIAKHHRVSEHTVRAIRAREAVAIAERKKTLAAMLANVAELGAERMEETIGKASLRDAAIGTGIAVDKMLALTGQMLAVQIANIVLPSDEERAARAETDRRLDEIARRIRELPPISNAQD
jgi:transposase-like protein